jgi:hypothetical protein
LDDSQNHERFPKPFAGLRSFEVGRQNSWQPEVTEHAVVEAGYTEEAETVRPAPPVGSAGWRPAKPGSIWR